MGAIKLNQIDSFKPYLTQQDMESIHDKIIQELNVYGHDGYELLEFECANGITIHIEVDYKGFNYRRIQLKQTYVMYKVNDEYKSIDEYENTLSAKFQDSIYDLNTKEEEEYELENQFS